MIKPSVILDRVNQIRDAIVNDIKTEVDPKIEAGVEQEFWRGVKYGLETSLKAINTHIPKLEVVK